MESLLVPLLTSTAHEEARLPAQRRSPLWGRGALDSLLTPAPPSTALHFAAQRFISLWGITADWMRELPLHDPVYDEVGALRVTRCARIPLRTAPVALETEPLLRHQLQGIQGRAPVAPDQNKCFSLLFSRTEFCPPSAGWPTKVPEPGPPQFAARKVAPPPDPSSGSSARSAEAAFAG